MGTPQISNLNLDGITLDYRSFVENGTLYIGGLIGTQDAWDGTSTIENCGIHISSVRAGSPLGLVYFGGIMADASKTVSISNCNVSFTGLPSALTGSTVYFGGFIGSSGANPTSITSSSLVGSCVRIEPSSGTRVGGLIGNKGDGRVKATSCSVLDSVSVIGGGSNLYCGTLFGYYAGRDTKITEEGNNLDFKVSFNGNPVTIGRYNTNLTNN